MGVTGGAEIKPQMFGANHSSELRFGTFKSPLRSVKMESVAGNKREGRFEGCKWWWKILIRHLHQLAKLLVCSNVGVFRVLSVFNWKVLTGKASGTIRMLNLKGGHKCICLRWTSQYRRTKWEKKRKEKKVDACVPMHPPCRGLWRSSEMLALLAPGTHFWLLLLLSVATWTSFDSPREVSMMANLAKRFFSLPSNISFHLQPQGRALAFPLEPGI